MKFIEDLVKHASKRNQMVCGDTFLCERTLESTEFVICDGIGSGVYANVAAVSCANRLIELFRRGVSLKYACEKVADSMHRARKEDAPFAAFSVAKILKDGQFTVYSYESPAPILIKDGTAQPLKPYFYTASYEIIGESSGTLGIGDSLVLCSDGATQAGLGNGYFFGIGAEGVADYINAKLSLGRSIRSLPKDIIEMCARVSGGYHADDTTVGILRCREATQLTIISGPPSAKAKDKDFAERLLAADGKRVVCGSTTADIISRELKKEAKLVKTDISFGSPPEYTMEGVDMVTEGAAMLNQVYNILDENPERFIEESAAERLCSLLQDADVVTFVVGNAVNDAHKALLFKQMGIRPRAATIKLLARQLRKMGKLVIQEEY
ncbi:MAG: SpoIIE family protein phosphatase [Clostridia bacterium]|jgi:hypothetical protein|nr:SpoIIE family protein phosphatase [Clostridia bacterium]